MRIPFLQRASPKRNFVSGRHAMLVDQNTESVVVPLNAALSPELGRLELANSEDDRWHFYAHSQKCFSRLSQRVGRTWCKPIHTVLF